MAKVGKRGKGRQIRLGEMEKIFYIKVKFEGIWGRKSNAKHEGWGKRIKGHTMEPCRG